MPPGGGAPTSTTTTVNEWSPEQQRLLGPITDRAAQFLNQSLSAPRPVKKRPNAAIKSSWDWAKEGLRPVMTAAKGGLDTVRNNTTQMGNTGREGLGGLMDAGGYGVSGLGQIIGGIGGAQDANEFLMSGALLDPRSNPVLAAQTAAATRPVFEGLRDVALPAVRSEFLGGDMFGSSRQGIAEGRAIEGALEQAGDIATQLQMNNFDKGLGAMISSAGNTLSAGVNATGQGLGALGTGTGQALNSMMQGLQLTPALSNLAFLPGQVMNAIGMQKQGLREGIRAEQNQIRMIEQMLPYMQAQQVANLAFGMGNGSSVATSQNAQPNPMMQGLGAMMMLPLMF